MFRRSLKSYDRKLDCVAIKLMFRVDGLYVRSINSESTWRNRPFVCSYILKIHSDKCYDLTNLNKHSDLIDVHSLDSKYIIDNECNIAKSMIVSYWQINEFNLKYDIS